MAYKPFQGGQDASLNQPLAGQIEPKDDAWKRATPALRREFYAHAGDLAVAEKRKELARALGGNGRRMRPRKHPRPDGANGPVLTPHDSASRTARLMAARAWDGGCTLFWHAGIRKGQAKPWGVILGYHAAGKVPGAPVRDVRLSTRGIGNVRKAMATWWEAKLKEQARRGRGGKAQKTAPSESFVGRATRAVAGAARKLADAFTRKPKGEMPPVEMARRYPSLAPYLRSSKDGFR